MSRRGLPELPANVELDGVSPEDAEAIWAGMSDEQKLEFMTGEAPPVARASRASKTPVFDQMANNFESAYPNYVNSPDPRASLSLSNLAKDYATNAAKTYAVDAAKDFLSSGAAVPELAKGASLTDLFNFSSAGPMSSMASAMPSAGAFPVGTDALGGTMMSDGTVAAMSPTGVQGAEAAAGGYSMLPGIVGAYGLYNLSQNRKRIGTGSGYLQGAASGAGIGWSVGGPVGAGIGAGLGLLGNALGIGHQSRTKVEQERRKALAEQGIVVPNSDIKEWELNDKFKQTRNESDLTGKDIIHAAQLYSMPGYANLDAAKQELIANEAVKQGLVREHHGTIDVSPNASLADLLAQQQGGGGASTQVRTDNRDTKPRKEKREKFVLADLLPDTIRAPDYATNVSPMVKNPYL